MNVLVVGAYDTAGQGARIKQAFDRLAPNWLVRVMSRERFYFDYPTDLPWRRQSLAEQYQAADVVHVRNDFAEYDRLAARFGPKPVVFHAHGSKYRSDPNRYVREAKERGATILCSTLDLWLLAPNDSEWLPAPYNVDELAALT